MKKFLSAFLLSLLYVSSVLAGPTPFKITNDTIVFGSSTSGADKLIQFNIGGSNPQLKYSISDGGFEFNTSFMRFGSGLSANQLFAFDIGLGASNPKIRYNYSLSKIQFSNNGTTYQNIGSSDGVSAISGTGIDWSLGNTFTQTLSVNTTFTFSNQSSGQVIVVRLTNTSSNYTVTWPGTVKWSGGTAPTMTTGAFSDVYTFFYDGANTYGSVVQNF